MSCKVQYMVEKGKVVGLKICFDTESIVPTDFESIGLVGYFEPQSRKIEPIYALISSTEKVRKWLNNFGGADIIEYVRYDKYAELLNELKEREKFIESLRESLAKKVEEIKRLYMKIKELNERIDELEFELAGKERPVC